MSWFRRIFPRQDACSALSEEIQAHLEERIDELTGSGMSRAGAIAEARRRFGNVTLTQERGREVWQWRWAQCLRIDAAHALRQMRANPGSTLVSLLSLALGIGAATAVFSVVYGVLLHPFPYRGADRMVQLALYDESGFRGMFFPNAAQFRELETAPVFDGAVAIDNWVMSLAGENLPEPVWVGQLSSNAFEYFGVPPALGRAFSAKDALQRVAVLSNRLWRSRYGASPAVLGEKLLLNRESYTIIGAMPASFTRDAADVYIPLRLTNDPERVLMVEARLRAGVSHQEAEQRLQPLLDRFAETTPQHLARGLRFRAMGLNQDTSVRLAGGLTVLLLAVSLLLAVACANVSILLLARGTARRHEFAVRCALGASRGRMFGQLLTESMLLALAGAGLGVLLAWRGLPLLVAWLPEDAIPRGTAIAANAPVLLFSAAVAILTGMVFGLAPAVQFSRATFARPVLAARSRTHHALIAGQVALTLLLLAGAGAAMRTFLNLYHTPLGYDPHHVLTMWVPLADDGNRARWQDRAYYFYRIREGVASIPGVTEAALTMSALPPLANPAHRVEVSASTAATHANLFASVQEISPEYFPALRIPLVKGRAWSEVETMRARHVAVVNQSMARSLWPGLDPIGRRLRFPDLVPSETWSVASPESNGWLEVIGVCGDVPNGGLGEAAAPSVYTPYTLVLHDNVQVVIRAEGDPAVIALAVRARIQSIAPNQPVQEFRTAEDLLRSQGWARERFVASLFAAFAGVGLLLAAVGLFSVVAYAVSQRTREFGIRIAIGARGADIVWAVMESSGVAVVAGLVVGLGLNVAFNRVFGAWTKGNTRDPLVLATITVLFLVVAAAAALIPARRAAAVEPVVALRTE